MVRWKTKRKNMLGRGVCERGRWEEFSKCPEDQMGLQMKKFLHIKGNNYQSQETGNYQLSK
jgi:hypothetical protein